MIENRGRGSQGDPTGSGTATTALTKAQVRAVEARGRSVCVVAGAGTGKTRVLVERYVRLLRDRLARVSEIVAITFTEKAAKEMRDRIREACRQRLREATGAEERRLWMQHRNDLDRAQISTIHSLCAQIIRECPVEAAVDPRFSVLDEVEGSILLRKVAKEELVKLIEAGDKDAVSLVGEYEFAKAMELVQEAVEHRDQLQMCLADFPDLSDEEAALQRWKKELAAVRAEATRRMLADARWRGAVAVLRETKPITPGDKIDLRRTEMRRILSQVEGKPNPEPALFSALREQCNAGGASAQKWAKEDLARVKEAFRALREVLDEDTGILGEMGANERKALRMARALVGAARRVIDTYAQRKRESGFLDFHDLELIAHDLLRKNIAAQERYRERIRYVLVDEFQDTNELQKEIVDALTGGEKTDRLFVVGDAKQSIYRFRGTDVSVFVAEERALAKAKGERVSLDTNFRSLPGLVGFANHFFGRLMGEERGQERQTTAGQRADYEAAYSALEGNRQEKPPHPIVEAIVFQRQEEDDADSLRRREAELIARRIRQMVDNEERLVYWPGEESQEGNAPWPVRFRHIAVLFRAMSKIWIYEQAFRDYSIPYYVVAGTGFYARQEVKDMLNLVRTLDNRTDDLSLAGVLRSPMFAVSDNTLYWLGTERKTSLYEQLLAHETIKAITPEERAKLNHACKVLPELLAMRDRVALPELLGRAVEMTRYDAVLLSQFLGKQKALNVYKVIALARKFDRRGIFTLHDFADYVGEFVTSDVREGEAPVTEEAGDVVKVMTIHKAKGLEFPVIFAADVSHREQPRGKDLYFDRKWGVALKVKDENDEPSKPIPLTVLADEEKRKEEAESKRLFYVAATRAQDYLVLSGWSPEAEAKGNDLPGPWFTWLDETFNLQEAGEEVAFESGRIRITRDVAYTPGTAQGVHRSWAQKFPDELAALKPLPVKVSVTDDALERRIAPVAHSLETKRRFTPSELQEYLWCPRAYYLNRVLGLPARRAPAVSGERSARAYAQLVGRVAHRALQNMVGRLKASLEDVLSAVMRETPDGDLRTLLAPPPSERILQQVGGMLARFRETATYQEILNSKEVLREFPFLVLFAKDFYLEGQMDLLYMTPEGWEVLDYKTGFLPDHAADGDDEADGENRAMPRPPDGTPQELHEVQLGAYCLAVEKLFGATPRGAGIFHLESNTRSRTAVTAEYLSNAHDRILGLIERIRQGDFKPAERQGCRCEYEWACH